MLSPPGVPGEVMGLWGGFLHLTVFISTGGSCYRFPNSVTVLVIVKLQSHSHTG